MRTHGSPKELERQRREAVALVQEGVGRSEVARRLGVSRSAVTRWCQAYDRFGEAGLAAKPHPGPRPKLNARQRQWLVQRLLKGAQANGYPTDVWTCPRIADLIQQRYGVSYHVDHIPRLMTSLGWSRQKPESRAVERNEQAVNQWIFHDWPGTKKSSGS